MELLRAIRITEGIEEDVSREERNEAWCVVLKNGLELQLWLEGGDRMVENFKAWFGLDC